jgi:predicted nucleic acid-binding protein
MTRWVLDASVIIKWALPERGEADTARAEEFLFRFADRSLDLVEPPHWLSEVAAVVSRLAPDRAREIVALLHEMEIPTEGSAEAYDKAVDLAVRLRHHVFDTLYHAVATVIPGAMLVTADDTYYRKARREGGVVRLADAVSLMATAP